MANSAVEILINANDRFTATTAKAQAQLKALQRSSSEFNASGIKGAADLGLAFSGMNQGVEKSAASFENSRIAAMGLSQEFGIHLPRAVTTFLGKTESIGPLLSAAFSTVAVIGMIQALGQLPALFDQIKGAITGWDDTAKKSFSDFLTQNKAAYDSQIKLNAALLGMRAPSATAGLVTTQAEYDAKKRDLDNDVIGSNATQKKIDALTKQRNAQRGGTLEIARLSAEKAEQDKKIATESLELKAIERELPKEHEKTNQALTDEALKYSQSRIDGELKTFQALIGLREGYAKAAAAAASITGTEETTLQSMFEMERYQALRTSLEKKLQLTNEMNSKDIAQARLQREQLQGEERAAKASHDTAMLALDVKFRQDLAAQQGISVADMKAGQPLSNFPGLAPPAVQMMRLGAAGGAFTAPSIGSPGGIGSHPFADFDALIQMMGPSLNEVLLQRLHTVSPESQIHADAERQEYETQKQLGRGAISGISSSVGSMFTDMVAKGDGFWKAFKSMGVDFSASFSSQFLEALTKGVLEPFQQQLGKMLDAVSNFAEKSIGNRIGGAVFGSGGKGGLLGKIPGLGRVFGAGASALAGAGTAGAATFSAGGITLLSNSGALAMPAIAAPSMAGAGLAGSPGLGGGAGMLGLGAATIPVIGAIAAGAILGGMALFKHFHHRNAPFTRDPNEVERNRTIYFATSMTDAMNQFSNSLNGFTNRVQSLPEGVIVANGLSTALAGSNQLRRSVAGAILNDDI